MPRLWLWWVDAEWMPEWLANRAVWGLQSGGPVAWPWRAYCRVRGHRPSDDHCGRPEHRYCAVCGKPTPGALVAP
jgi:hypothetical protein